MFEKFKYFLLDLWAMLTKQGPKLPLRWTTGQILRMLRADKGIVYGPRQSGRSTALLIYAHDWLRQGIGVTILCPTDNMALELEALHDRLFGPAPYALRLTSRTSEVLGDSSVLLVDNYDQLTSAVRGFVAGRFHVQGGTANSKQQVLVNNAETVAISVAPGTQMLAPRYA